MNIRPLKEMKPKFLIFMAVIVILPLLFFGYLFYNWFFPIDPPYYPSAAEVGENPLFDTTLENVNNSWLFLFQRDDSIIETDIYGEESKVIIDIKEITQNEDSELLSDVSLSPSGTHLAINYFNSRRNDEWTSPVGRLLIFNLENGEFVDFAPELLGFRQDESSPAYWLSDEVFIVKMHRFLTSDPEKRSIEEEIMFIRYDLSDLTKTNTYKLPIGGAVVLQFPDTNALIYFPTYEIPNKQNVFVIDSKGMRLNNEMEFEYVRKYHYECGAYPHNCLLRSAYDFPEIEVEQNHQCSDCSGKFINERPYGQFIYLDNELVVITEYSYGEPEWDPGLRLFIWDEWDGADTYIMDEYGHYRYWFFGYYIGKYRY